jgi:hypothetical protein
VYLSACTPEDPDNERHRVYRRPHDDIPDFLKGEAFWIDSPLGSGYYVDQGSGPEPVEFVDNHWYHIFLDPYSNIYWTSDNELIDIEEEGTGYWPITDPHHPEHDPESYSLAHTPGHSPSSTHSYPYHPGSPRHYLSAPTSEEYSNPHTPRESGAPISEEEPLEVTSICFATPPNSDKLEYLELPTTRDELHIDIITGALEQIVSFCDLEPAPDSPEHEPLVLERVITDTTLQAAVLNPDPQIIAYPAPEALSLAGQPIHRIPLPVIRVHPAMAHQQAAPAAQAAAAPAP